MSIDRSLIESRILIVDDTAASLLVFERLLESAGYFNVQVAKDRQSALSLAANFVPDLILVSLETTSMDPCDLLRALPRAESSGGSLPVLVFGSEASTDKLETAIQAGATDFLSKGSDPSEIKLRIGNYLRNRALQGELREMTHTLEVKVNDRTRALWNSQIEVLERLAMIAELKDDDAPDHCRRVAEISARTARCYGLDNSQVELIRLTSPLHDIGKVALSDHVLTKPGKLTDEELREMAKHTVMGAAVLSGGKTPLLQMAESIAKHHHERWDGSGYPDGLIGEAIPLPARIVGLADSFDSSMIARSYRKALSVEDAMAEVVMNSGVLFDPRVVAAFVEAFKTDQQRNSLRLIA